jgi:hypothetical protein
MIHFIRYTVVTTIAIFFILLPACSGQRRKIAPAVHAAPSTADSLVNITPFQDISYIHAETSPVVLQEYEARVPDVPCCMGARLKRGALFCDHAGKSNLMLEYEISQEPKTIVAWYCQQLEYQGWLHLNTMHSFYTLMMFSKPDKRCHITMMPHQKNKKRCLLIIWIFAVDES